MKTHSKALLTLMAIGALLFCNPSAEAGGPYAMGTGGKNGVYYPVGQAIAGLYNKSISGKQISALVSKGSVQNLQQLEAGKIKLAIVQADTASKAFNGKLPFQKGKPYKNLRAVLALHTEDMTLIASKKSGIKKLTDIKGKRVAIGPPGSGTLQNTELALRCAGLSIKDLGKAYKIGPPKAVDQLLAGKIDAMFYFVGHPNKCIKKLSKSKMIKFRLIPIPNIINKILLKHDYYVLGHISNINYRGILNRFGVDTFGIKALLVADKNAPASLIKGIVTSVLTDLKKFKKQHKALMFLSPQKMVKGVPIPFHPAAKKILQAQGVLR